jgi:hypothetical protein
VFVYRCIDEVYAQSAAQHAEGVLRDVYAIAQENKAEPLVYSIAARLSRRPDASGSPQALSRISHGENDSPFGTVVLASALVMQDGGRHWPTNRSSSCAR